MDKSILMQKQVKDNAEDLQKEFLDMKNWEEQMKRKDEELRKETTGQNIIPPVRSKNKSKIKNSSIKYNDNNNKPKRIKSYDYSSWDKFDVDKACKSIDKEEQSDDSGDEAMSKRELEKAHEVATKHKNEGNTFVQKQEWAKAIGCYNQAIKLFPYDAVFYANRALCQLKLDNLYSAESDSSTAIQLDETYVKAYHRRATARMNLKQYKEAKQDLEKVLKLEPSNKEAKSLLTRIESKITVSERASTLKEGTLSPKSTNIIDTKYNKEDRENVENDKNFQKDNESDIRDIVTKQRERNPRIPDWLPEKDDVAIIEPIEKPPHLRSKKLLTRIAVKEVEFATMRYHDSNEIIACNKSEPTESKKCNCDYISKKNDELINVTDSPANISDLPSVPKTAVQFIMHWKTNKSSEFRYAYLKQLPENSLPKIFQDSMESDIFSQILEVLKIEFLKKKEPIFCYLRDLSQVKRFRALIMFISNSEKENLRILFEYCKANENVFQEEIITLQEKYEI